MFAETNKKTFKKLEFIRNTESLIFPQSGWN